MSWTAPMPAVAGAIFTAAQYNTFVRDNLNECAPAKASVVGSYFTTSDDNQIAERKAVHGGRIGGNASGTDSAKMSWACSGASSISASDTWAAGLVKFGQYSFAYCNRGYLATGLNPGLNTFTAKYAASGGTGFAGFRTIIVMPF